MPAKPLTDAQLREAITAFQRADFKINQAARESGMNRVTLMNRLDAARARGIDPKAPWFERDPLPDPDATVEDILERRRKEFRRIDEAYKARQLIPVRIKAAGPIGVVHFGDPHVDDPGTDIEAIERHLTIIKKTPGLFGANVGDLQNNWIGRLARLYGEQSTSATEAWKLVEWMVESIDWLYLIGGNHDAWSGPGDPLQWIARAQTGIVEAWGARLNMIFPNGKMVRVNARHDWPGNSMWNPAHGPAKAVQMGVRDHIVTCGHLHISGYNLVKDDQSELISHVLRVAGFKVHDRFAREKGFKRHYISPSATTIIDPRYGDGDPRLISTFHDVEQAADFLTFLRARA